MIGLFESFDFIQHSSLFRFEITVLSIVGMLDLLANDLPGFLQSFRLSLSKSPDLITVGMMSMFSVFSRRGRGASSTGGPFDMTLSIL